MVHRQGWAGSGRLIRPGLVDRPGPADRDHVVVVVAHLFRYKRVEDAIAGFRRSGLSAEGYRLDIYGGPYDRPYADTLERLAAEGSGVNLLGPRAPEETHRAVAQAAVVVQPSACENAPQIVYEAIGRHTPLIASDIGAHRELLANGLYPLGDTEALARAMRDAVKNPAPARTRVELQPWSQVALEIADYCAQMT
jgi:glycosyltransferase involved in cell wall biosynthesis